MNINCRTLYDEDYEKETRAGNPIFSGYENSIKSIEYVGAISATKSGKYSYTVCEIDE